MALAAVAVVAVTAVAWAFGVLVVVGSFVAVCDGFGTWKEFAVVKSDDVMEHHYYAAAAASAAEVVEFVAVSGVDTFGQESQQVGTSDRF